MSGAPGRVMALDLGHARIGVAVSDPLGLTAQPLETVERTGLRYDLERIVCAATERDVTTVVVGLPLLLSGEAGKGAERARAFAARLARVMPDVEVQCWDERLTTVEAQRAMSAAGVPARKKRRVVDQLAAVLILQSFLDAHRNDPAPRL